MTTEETEARIKEAHLIAASPEVVYEELRKYGEKLKCDRFNYDDDLEKSLLIRDDPLINLGLARYAHDSETLKAVYKKTAITTEDPLQVRYLSGLRVACLSNEVSGEFGCYFPETLLDDNEYQRLISEGVIEEVNALFNNPSINEPILERLYNNEDEFSSLSDERRAMLVGLSATNPRLTTVEDSVDAPDLYYLSIQRAILNMLATAPTTREWFEVLSEFITELDWGNVCSPDEPITDILERWKNIKIPENDILYEGYYSRLSRVDEFRCLLAALYGCYSNKELEYRRKCYGDPKSKDITLRCAYYGKGELSEKDMLKGYERDEEVYVLAALCNNHIFLKPELRKLLEGHQLYGSIEHFYKRQCEFLHQRWSWFDQSPVTDYFDGDEEQETGKNKELIEFIESSNTGLAKALITLQKNIILVVVLVAVILYFLLR